MICVTIGCGSHRRMLEEWRALAEDNVKFVELRLDFLRKEPQLHRLLPDRPTAVLATVRRPEDGGKWRGTEEERLRLLRALIAEGVEYIDLESDVAASIPRFGKTKRIVSYHNMSETPEDLDALREKILATCDPDIVKIAVTPKSINDVFRLIEFEKRANSQRGKPRTLAISMTEMGFFTRVLGKKWGCPYTYASFSKTRTLAPGLPYYKVMRDQYRYDEIDAETEVFGVVADPVQHSLSPLLHNSVFAEQKYNGVYLPFRIPKEDLATFVDRAQGIIGLKGLSVTIPHKTEIIQKLSFLDPAVETIGACNTVVFDGLNRYGYNTDYLAAVHSIEATIVGRPLNPNEPSPLNGLSAMVLGAGGAGKALAYGLHERGARVIIADRNSEKGEQIARWLGCEFCSWEERGGYVVQVLANCTPIGMFPNVDESPMELKYLRGGMYVFDAVYNPETTYLLRMARDKGAKTISGVQMFVGQACLQYKLFTGHKASVTFMRKVTRDALAVTRVRDADEES
ncbi:MAG: shikimate dehydrogenase [Planctomycetia bacterium]|nr:shikimate dehydrogenase [Planctomycetia bacterium]